MSLRLRLIGLIAVVFAVSLLLGGMIACFNASRSVQTEMRSASAVARQLIETGIAGLGRSQDPKRDLENLIASFKGNRHLRVVLAGDGAAVAAPVVEEPPLGQVPRWFERLIGVKTTTVRVPVSIGGQDYGAIVIETDPHNEILEIWDEFGDGLLVLALFSGPTMLLVYLFIGRALQPLDRLAEALARIGQGDYGVRLAGKLPPELSQLRDSFNRMAGQLAAMDAENRRLNEQLLTLQEDERSRLARDLHDEIGPFLFAINVDAANIVRQIDAGRLAPIRSHVQSIAEAVGHMQKQVRSMLGRLRPIGLAEFGLAEAIGNLIEFWQRRYPDIVFRFEIAPETESFGELIDPTIFRVVQECLSNAVRHSQPTGITVSIGQERGARDDHEEVVVSVADNGQGMTAPSGTGYGLLGMSERVKAMGGTLTIASQPGAGLTVTAAIPYPPAGSPTGIERVAAS
jgi:two-component system sensor histidine kinase UhpB